MNKAFTQLLESFLTPPHPDLQHLSFSELALSMLMQLCIILSCPQFHSCFHPDVPLLKGLRDVHSRASRRRNTERNIQSLNRAFAPAGGWMVEQHAACCSWHASRMLLSVRGSIRITWGWYSALPYLSVRVYEKDNAKWQRIRNCLSQGGMTFYGQFLFNMENWTFKKSSSFSWQEKTTVVPCWHCFLARNQILCITCFYKLETNFMLHKASKHITEPVKYTPMGTRRLWAASEWVKHVQKSPSGSRFFLNYLFFALQVHILCSSSLFFIFRTWIVIFLFEADCTFLLHWHFLTRAYWIIII